MIPLNSNLAPLKRSAIRVYTNLARQTPDCAMLTIGEPDFDTPEAVKQAVASILNVCGFVLCFSVMVGLLDAKGLFS